jgi:raffinose/stachyose/melibiose transport system permease protein
MTATLHKTHQTSASKRSFKQLLTPWLFILPLALLSLVVHFIPAIATFGAAFTDWSGFGTPNFVGLRNFQDMLNDRVFFRALTNNLIWTAIFLTVPVSMGLIGAALLAPIKRFQMFYRIAFFIPYTLAAVINAQIWKGILHPVVGVSPWMANTFGLEWLRVNFLGNPDLALYTVAFVDNWRFWGFLLVLYLTAMQNIDAELYEAARIEGATRWQEFVHITFPGIRPTFVFTILMIVIWSFLVFDYIFVLTDPLGGPANSTEMLATFAYTKGFRNFNVGYATATSMTMVLVTLLITSVFTFLRRRGWDI